MKLFLAATSIALSMSGTAFAKVPDCTSPRDYPAEMGQSQLNGEGLFDTLNIDFSKTKVATISSVKIGRDLYRQVHDVKYFRRDGSFIEAIIVGTVSSVECAGNQFDVYLVSHKIVIPPSEYDPSLDKKKKK